MKLTLKPALLATFFICFSAFQSQAHDFWLQPRSFEIPVSDAAPVDILIGHADDTSRWPLAPDRLIGLRSIGPEGLHDQMPHYNPAQRFVRMKSSEAGLHWLMIETQDAVSTLNAERFNNYIKNEGLRDIQADRLTTRSEDEPGVERYSRRGKALMAVGDWLSADDAHITRPLGLTLEITPKQNPAIVSPGVDIEWDVRYRGRLVPFATVKIINLDGDVDMQIVKTNKAGLFSIPRPETGLWMYHVVWGTPLPDKAEQDYDTIFSSLTFDASIRDMQPN